ncbi:G-protein coupled receptor 183-like [Paramacrobiotus metropolitanus]|uniref:G-protein coupled receptor 183-like n=1 Tax=Paramacrobiotus metropolitanus TaxID=2943436 RepID=UPI0024461F25|nr:G-protein coupled receptor 183-like [Paramacrobiotus metropolitanus]
MANLFHSIASSPLEIALLLSPGRQHPAVFCSIVLHFMYISNALMMQCHVLITSNRVWAIIFPLSYRQHHSTRTAVFLCVLTWLSTCVVLLPGLLMDALYFRETGDNVTCLMDPKAHPSLYQWSMATQILLYVLPIGILVAAYLLICWKRHQRGTRGVVSRLPTESMSINQRKQSSKAFTALTLLTVAVVVCWTPLAVCYCLLNFSGVVIATFFQVARYVWAIEPVLDPIFFIIAFDDLRAELRDLLRMRFKCVRTA